MRPLLIAVLTLWAAAAHAVYPDPVNRSGIVDEDWDEAEKLINQQRFEFALPFLRAALTRHAGNADLQNLAGFAYRKAGKLEESYRHYAEALRIDPDHRAAREYLGELFLMRNEPDKAREQLAVLARLCPDGCEERAELESAIKNWEGGKR